VAAYQWPRTGSNPLEEDTVRDIIATSVPESNHSMSISFLNGLRVLDCTSLVAGPFCGKLLADAGADVIKIESPKGDISRHRGPFPSDHPNPEKSLLHHYVNVNKRGVTLDLDHEAGREAFRRLVKASDMLIEDKSPGDLAAMGLSYEDLERVNPNLIMISMTPFGQTGPHTHWKAYNLNSIHAGGEGWLMPPGLAQRTFPDREPLKTGAYVGEYYCGVTAASAAMIAIFGRAAMGRGQHVDMSKQEAHATLARIAIGMWAQSGFVETRATRDIPYGGCVPCKDGHAEVLFHIADNHWKGFVRMMGDPEWAHDPKFDSQQGRSEHGAEVNKHLFAWAKTRTKREIYDEGLKHGFPCGIFYAPSEIAASEHEQARGFFVELSEQTPIDGMTKIPGLPFQFSDHTYTIERFAPVLGEHTTEVLRDVGGYTTEEISLLRNVGAV